MFWFIPVWENEPLFNAEIRLTLTSAFIKHNCLYAVEYLCFVGVVRGSNTVWQKERHALMWAAILTLAITVYCDGHHTVFSYQAYGGGGKKSLT